MNKLILGTFLFAVSLSARTQDAAPTAPAAATSDAVSAPSTSTTAADAKVTAKTVVRADRLDLETTVVTGNRELPKVLYIVPWKRADLGELPAQPFNTLLDEVLQPVDRDVFKREVKYFQAVSSGADAEAAKSKLGVTPPALH